MSDGMAFLFIIQNVSGFTLNPSRENDIERCYFCFFFRRFPIQKSHSSSRSLTADVILQGNNY